MPYACMLIKVKSGQKDQLNDSELACNQLQTPFILNIAKLVKVYTNGSCPLKDFNQK